MELKEKDTIITAFAEAANGPGWSNRPVWVIIRDRTGKLREICLQPEEQGSFIPMLYNISQAVHLQMKKEVEEVLYEAGDVSFGFFE